ncbi:MAG: glycoside hydrolase family 5 protein [Verrucomicrobiota bacterium]
MTRAIFLLIALSIPSPAQEPIRQTTEARLWLRIPGDKAPLRDIRVSTGIATPASWEKDPAVRERFTDVIFPVRWWDWREMTLSFTPLEDGTVDLVLNGPWEEEKPGTAWRKEVLWDQISAEGTSLGNGGFESLSDGNPDGWKSIYGGYPAADTWPLANTPALEGKSVAASWQNRPLAQTLELKAGQKVTLRFHAKAATLPDFAPPKRLGQDTPAHQALAKIKRGVNLGNCWDAPPPYSWGIRYTTEDIDRIAAEGFDHIRVPVAWTYNLKATGDGYEVDPAILTDLEPVLRRALEKGMHVLLDWHHFDDLTTNPAAHRARFVASWEGIARHFKSWPPELFLELLNEPRDALTTEIANPIHADTIAAIRKIDPERIIFVSPGNWGDIRELDKLRLPDGDDRVVVTVHCYESFYYTHQGAHWVRLGGLRGIIYPGPPATPLKVPDAFKEDAGIRDFVEGYNTLPADRNPCSPNTVRQLLDLACDWSAHFGRPVHLGEFGSHNIGDQGSRSRYSHDVRTLAEDRKIPWALWDWKATFGYWDTKNNQPLFRPALFD